MSSCSLYLSASVATNAFASSTVENSTNTNPLNKKLVFASPHFDQHGLSTVLKKGTQVNHGKKECLRGFNTESTGWL